MVGQEQVVKTLINQIKNGRVGHAYLFTGARGTGKTTAAKIFARAINCLHPVNGSPCGECEVCKKLADPQNLDVLEIDAASNNKVDNVRDIREKIQYPPVSGAYKVYIIDEAHMLTNEAFNALLKTLEEPPKHAVIILATTEPHKLPSTILSRCMRFDFKLVPEKTIEDLIKEIYRELGKEFEDQAITQIARAGEGSVRDALSVADTCVSYSEGKLTYKDVIEVLGASDGQKTLELAEAILKGNVGETLSVCDSLISAGKSVSLVARDLSSVFRNMMIVKTCPNGSSILSVPEADFIALKKASELSDGHGIFRAAEIFAGVENDLRYSTNARVVFETAAVKAAMPSADYNIDALLSRIAKLEDAFNNASFSSPAPVSSVDEKTEKPAYKPVIEQKTEITKQEDNDDRGDGSENVTESYPETTLSEHKKDDSIAATFNPAYSAYIAEYDDDEPVPEDNTPVENQIGFDLESVSSAKKDDENESVEYAEPIKKEKAEIVEENKPKFSDARIWGTVIRRLRAEKKLMLWIACQEQEAKTEEGRFVIVVDGENEYSTIVKEENISAIRSIVAEMTSAQVVVVLRGQQNPEENDDKAIEKLKNVFGDVKIVE